MFCSFFNIFVFVCIKFHFIKNHHVGLTFDFTCTLQSMNSVSFFFVCVSFVSVLEEQNKNEINLNYALFGLDVVFFQPVIIFSRKKIVLFPLDFGNSWMWFVWLQNHRSEHIFITDWRERDEEKKVTCIMFKNVSRFISLCQLCWLTMRAKERESQNKKMTMKKSKLTKTI